MVVSGDEERKFANETLLHFDIEMEPPETAISNSGFELHINSDTSMDLM